MRTLSLIALLASVAFAQSPTFEIADVHASAKKPTERFPQPQGGVLRGDRYELRDANMVDLISAAYRVEADKVLGGPSWIEADRYDVIAKAPRSTPPETVSQMLQALLADRFKLVIHTETKQYPVFVLSLGKGKAKLKEAKGDEPSGCRPVPQDPSAGIPYQVVSCRNMTMEAFSQELRAMANAYLPNPVIDSTGIKGSWDIDLKWTGRGRLAAAGSDGISVFDAVDKQLGLKLEPRMEPMQAIRVDSVNQTPTANPAAVTTKLPAPPPAEFEVADIKPSASGAAGQGIRLLPGGRLDVTNMPLRSLITLAWDIRDDMLVGPKSIDTTHWDVVAKAPVGPQDSAIDIDAVRQMIRTLLADRFKLTTHMEDRPTDAYTLLAGKPKMQKADPSNRTGCKDGPGPDGKDPRIANPVFNRLFFCQNVTMAQFAERLQGLVSGYIRSPVLDATGIEGSYDFTLNFSGIGQLQGTADGGGGRSGGPRDAAPSPGGNTDPNGALSLPDAISKQLGLKLELQKRPVPVLVVDHVEDNPTEN